MVALSLHSMTTTMRSHGMLSLFYINEKCIGGCQFMSKSLLNTQ